MKSDEMETLKILGAVNVDVDAPRGVIRWDNDWTQRQLNKLKGLKRNL